MKKYFLAVFALLLCMTGCQGNADTVQADTVQAALENQQTTSEVTTEQTNEQTTKSIETTTETTTSTTIAEEVSEDIAVSREYEFDLDKFLERTYTEKYLLRDELDFLNDEQYDTYIRAWIFIDSIDYADEMRVPDTSDVPTNWIDENGEICGEYTYPSYRYISTYQSFYEYLQSVFTQDAVDKILSDERFLNVDGELYFSWGEAGGYIYTTDDKYELVEKTDSEVIFEYNASHTHDGKNLPNTSRTIKLINAGDGWRAELFEHLIKFNEAEREELEKMEQQEQR